MDPLEDIAAIIPGGQVKALIKAIRSNTRILRNIVDREEVELPPGYDPFIQPPPAGELPSSPAIGPMPAP